MALTIGPVPAFAPKGALRQERAKAFVLTPDGSKPAGGYTIAASALGYSTLDFGICGPVNDGSFYTAALKVGTAQTDCTVQFFSINPNSSTASVSAVSASDTKLTTNPVTVLVVGR